MADRQLFRRDAVAPKGRFESRMNLDRAGVAPGPVYTTGNDLPLGRMGGAGFEAQQGGANLSAARGMGMRTAPVAMSMGSWRKAHKAGLTVPYGNVENFARRAEIRRFGGTASVGLVVDTTDMWNLARGFTGISVAIRRGHSIISMAINDGMRGLKTGLRRKLVAWTGIRSYAETERGMRVMWSTPATMTATLRVTDRHRRIGKNFGASWSRANPGGTHSAWNRPQLAVGSFMAKGILFKRVGSGRLPIAPLWGPNMAREIERHRAEVEADVVTMARTRVHASMVRLMSSAIASGGRRGK